jgi:predicted metal-dependent phosphoesterase TrpH
VLKVELHSHTDNDRWDLIPYTTEALIERSAACGYDALAITLHNRQLDLTPYIGYARELGLTLIPGSERTIEGKHVLLLNFGPGVDDVHSFDDLARLKRRQRGLVVAPHPFFPMGNCLQHACMDRHADLFDAVEYNGMFTAAINFNRPAERWARAHGKPMVGNGDIHRLTQLDTTWSLIDAEPHPDAICEAIRAGKVRVKARPHSAMTAAQIMASLFAADIRRDVFREVPAGRRPRVALGR